MIIRYSCKIDNDVISQRHVYRNEIDTFKGIVKGVLNDPNGWRKYGFVFLEIQDSNDEMPDNKDVLIRLCTEEHINNSGMNGFSFYDPTINTICVNMANWTGRSPASRGDWFNNLIDYRTYVINHEMGHHLSNITGSTHDPHYLHNKDAKDRGKPCPIMVQQTRGKDFCTPYIPNKYPTDADLHVIGLNRLSGGKRMRVNQLSGGEWVEVNHSRTSAFNDFGNMLKCAKESENTKFIIFTYVIQSLFVMLILLLFVIAAAMVYKNCGAKPTKPSTAVKGTQTDISVN